MKKLEKKKFISACLLGIKCRYNGEGKLNKRAINLIPKEFLIPICPEQLGGLSTPREPAETTGGGLDVLEGRAKVITKSGKDVTSNFVQGAKEILRLVKLFNVKEVILKQKSPSCGCGKIYDGTFSNRVIKGDGVTTVLLKRNRIKVISEEDL